MDQLVRADLVVTPELSLCGYPPEDLVLRSGFRAASRAAKNAPRYWKGRCQNRSALRRDASSTSEP